MPNVVSGKHYREFLMQQNEARSKKKKDTECTCVYCEGTYSKDKKNKKNLKWIDCDDYNRKMHVSCTPRTHLVKVHLEESREDEEVDLMVLFNSCVFCYRGNKFLLYFLSNLVSLIIFVKIL